MEYWEPSQRVLQGDVPLVRRPKLTETLLKKPPFRFLHDVISEVCRQTGFAEGLYSGEELISTNMKDKESKVAYLWKIIDCVGITLNTNVPVRPLKIVAGLEPEQTNVFLQMLAAATMVDKQQSERAVVRVLAGEKQPPSSHSGLEWIQLISEAMSAPDANEVSQQPPETMGAEQHATQASDKQLLSSHKPTDGNLKVGLGAMEIRAVHEASMTSNDSLKPTIGSSEQEQLNEQPLERGLNNESSLRDVNLPSSLGFSEIQEADFNPTPHPCLQAIYNLSSDMPSAVTQGASSKNSTPKKSCQSRPTSTLEGGSKLENITRPSDVAESTLPSPNAVSHSFVGEIAKPNSVAPSCHEPREKQVIEDAVAPAPPVCSTPRLSTPAGFPTTSYLSGQRPQSARPQSARKAPPVIRSVLDKVGAKDMQGTPLERPGSARISGMELPTFTPVRKPAILLDVEPDEDEQENMPILLPPPSIQEATQLTTSVEGAGKLVRDILENKADLPEQKENRNCEVAPANDSLTVSHQQHTHRMQGKLLERIDDAEETGIILGQIRGTRAKKGDFQSRKEEIRKLREAVQTLCQTVNPLGKSIDHLQEDAEIMSKEYQFWIKERDTGAIRVDEEKRITEEMLQAESDRILKLDEEIKQQNQRILSLKAQILRNDQTIMKLLRRVTSRTLRC